MNIKPTKADTDYRAALQEIEALMSAEFESPQGEKTGVASLEGREVTALPLGVSFLNNNTRTLS